MKKFKYCRLCGSKLNSTKIQANKIKVNYYDSLGCCAQILDNPFDSETGEKNMAELLECPNATKFFNNHDKVVIYKNDYHFI